MGMSDRYWINESDGYTGYRRVKGLRKKIKISENKNISVNNEREV